MKLDRVVEMTITRQEFLRLLPAAINHVPFRESTETFFIDDPDTAWQIRFEIMSPLRPGGMIKLERHRVSFLFTGMSDDDIAARLKRFEFYFRRGGG